MQQYQDKEIPSVPTASKQHQLHGKQLQLVQEQQKRQPQEQHPIDVAENTNRLHTSNAMEGSVDPGGFRPRVGSLGLNAVPPQEEISHHIISTSGLAVATNRLVGAAGVGDWEYFDEAGYIRGGALRTGEDPYIRNRFNQEASDTLPSNREIPDTRHPM